MDGDWQLVEAGPPDAGRTVLLLPGGMCGARSYAEVMAEPLLAGTHLVAATLPGHAGAPAPADFSIGNYARLTADLAKAVGANVVVGFSIGATVALEMVTSGGFAGPVVLVGISLSAKDEPAFFHALVRLGAVLGTLPATLMSKGAASMVKRVPVTRSRQDELREDFSRNVPRDTRQVLREYARWLHEQDRPAEKLCESGVPSWIVHADKGDGGLTDHERRILEACPNAHVVTIRGTVHFFPNEVPQRIAEVIAEAAGIGRSASRS